MNAPASDQTYQKAAKTSNSPVCNSCALGGSRCYQQNRRTIPSVFRFSSMNNLMPSEATWWGCAGCAIHPVSHGCLGLKLAPSRISYAALLRETRPLGQRAGPVGRGRNGVSDPNFGLEPVFHENGKRRPELDSQGQSGIQGGRMVPRAL